MKLMKKNDDGFDIILSKYFKLFNDCGTWFCYIILPRYTIRLSYGAGSYIYDRKVDKYLWQKILSKDVGRLIHISLTEIVYGSPQY